MNCFSFSTRKLTQLSKQGHRNFYTSAFSLIEVAFAVGIFTFGFVAVVGLIPMGLTTFHKAVGTSVSSQVVQQVTSVLQQTDYYTLMGWSGSTTPGATQVTQLFYFDDQGSQLGTAPSPPPSGTLYYVNSVVTTPAAMPGGSPSLNLAYVVIEIVNNPGNRPLTYDPNHSVVPDPAHGIAVSRFSAYIAKSQ